MSLQTDSIRNVAIAGHGSTGKTSLVEQILFQTGVIGRAEAVESGKSTSDHTDEEAANGISIHASLTHVNWKDRKINMLDTPGAADFVGEVIAAFRACESALLVISGKAGVQIETIKLWRLLERRGKPRLVFIGKMDEEGADFEAAVESLSSRFETSFVPVSIPMGTGSEHAGVIDLIRMKAYTAGNGGKESETEIPDTYQEAANTARAALIELAAEGDDELVEKFLAEETLSTEDIIHGLKAGTADGRLVPVATGAALSGSGISSLLDIMAYAARSPMGIEETVVSEDGTESKLAIAADAEFSGLCFKTTIDQFSGKLSFVKVVTGCLTSDTELSNAREMKKERVNKFFSAQGKKLEEVHEVCAGDIAVLAKLSSANTSDTFCTPSHIFNFRQLALPQPVFAVAVEGTEKKDEDKLGDALHKVVEEDLTLHVDFNGETKETVVSGMGELHINIVLNRIRTHQKVAVNTHVPRIAYRETIIKSTEATYRHKKQSGGHGQFGEVTIKIRPLERGEQYAFNNLIRGMAVSKGYIPGIEKGLKEAMSEGVLAGYPMVDIGTELLDGKEHPVDSSEMAFKLAAKGAMLEAVGKAKPTLLEPIMNLEIFIEDQYLGDVLSDLTSKRGRVLGQDALGGGLISIRAQVPQAELLRYAIDLRSITSGTGAFELEFSHYAAISGKIADDVIKSSHHVAEAHA
jgi:elongation factor G